GKRRIVLTGVTGSQPGWLADGFLEGQRVRVCTTSGALVCADLKIQLIRGDNASFDTILEFTGEGAFPWANGTVFDAKVVRLAVVATFTPANWYVPQRIELRADPFFSVPDTRKGVKFFPATRHLLSRLQGPLSVEGGVTGADRTLKPGVKLPGER